MNYQETLSYLFKQLPMYQRQGKSAFKKDLTNIVKLCDLLDNPHQKLKTIHVAGTNGKGTVSHILAAFFQKNGYKTGLYTSPHYKDFRERIKIDGKYISKKRVVKFVAKHKKIIEEIQPSFFEITVAMAFNFFMKKQVDIAIIETGLGGRLDSTNIINPLLSVITNISLDHTEMLGDTKAKIAAEKAGIIKTNVPVIIGKKDNETDEVFEKIAKEKNAKLTYALDKTDLKIIKNNFTKSVFEIENTKYKCDLSGPFFEENIRTAFAAISVFKGLNTDFKLEKLDFAKKIKKQTNFKGRWTVLGKNPLIIADAAHNIDALKALFNYVAQQNIENVHCIIGFVKDKNIDEIMDVLPENVFYHLVAAKIERSLPVKDLEKLFDAKGLSCIDSRKSVFKTYLNVFELMDSDGLLLICGSSFVVAEVV